MIFSLLFCIVTQRKINLLSFILNCIIEDSLDTLSHLYGITITRILEAYAVSLCAIPFISVKQCYNTPIFDSMSYILVDDVWVCKSKIISIGTGLIPLPSYTSLLPLIHIVLFLWMSSFAYWKLILNLTN